MGSRFIVSVYIPFTSGQNPDVVLTKLDMQVWGYGCLLGYPFWHISQTVKLFLKLSVNHVKQMTCPELLQIAFPQQFTDAYSTWWYNFSK